MALPITFPSNLPRDFERIRGAAMLYVAPYQSRGAVAVDPYYFGQVADGGFGINAVRSYADVEGEEEFEAASDILVKEQTTVKCTLQQVPVETLAVVLGSSATFATAATLASMNADNTTVVTPTPSPARTELGYGDMNRTTPVQYWQVLVRAWNENLNPNYQVPVPVGPLGPQYWQPVTSGMGYWQIFQSLIVPSGEMKHEKKGIVQLPIEIKARWDWSVTPLVDSTTSRGRLWRRVVVTA